MEAPGLSLFQGSDSIHIKAGGQRQEEEEEQEDLRRRGEELQDILTNAFDEDYEEDDDASSINSSHNYTDASRCLDHSVIDKSYMHEREEKGSTVSQYQNDFGIYGQRDTSSFPTSDTDKGPTVSDMQREFGVYGRLSTPRNNNMDNKSSNSIAESPYELPRPPSLTNPASYPHDLRAQINDGYTLLENYPYNYQTPSNHYDGVKQNYQNNGYIGTYENNIAQKESRNYSDGGNDNESEHHNHCYKTGPNGCAINDSNAYKIAEYNSKEQLEVLYSVRMKEIQQLTEELQQLHAEKEEEKNQLIRKLALAQAETERSNLSRNQAQNSLVDAKAEIVELQSQVAAFKEKIAVMEKTNQNMSEDLSVAKSSVVELQQKINVLERVQTLQANDKTHEKFLKQAQEKHCVEMRNMQTQIDLLTDKLNAKESSYVALEHKLADVRRAHETLVVEKGDNMNRLAEALELSQTQCRNLMASNNVQENIQLQSKVKLLSQEKEELQTMIQELQHKLEVAKADVYHYDSMLAATMEEGSDSIRQLKLGEYHNKSRANDDITNKLQSELQRCIAGQAVKRKEITRLESGLAQKEKELEKAQTLAETCQQEAARYAKRVNELEQELKSLLTEHTAKANSQINRLSEHLTEMKNMNESLRREKQSLEEKLEETLAHQEETLQKLHQDTLHQREKQMVEEYNKEYLEIHDKAVERVRQEAQDEILQLTVQLEQTQKELNRVKEMYIDVCGTKEKLINDHRCEIQELKATYAKFDTEQSELERIKREFDTQTKITLRLTHECEAHKNKIIDLEKDLSNEKKYRVEYRKKIDAEIERAKDEALAELRNSHPDHQISVLFPDHCKEHSEKIAELEEDCKRLELKLSSAIEEQKKILDLQSELDDKKIKIAQMEIVQETIKQKYEALKNEKQDLLIKLSQSEQELLNSRTNKIDDSKPQDYSLKIQVENEALSEKCDSLLRDKMEYKKRLSEMQIQLNDSLKKMMQLETNISRSDDRLSNTRNDVEKELSQYKDFVKQLTEQLNNSCDGRKKEMYLDAKVKQLELELQEKDAQLERLKDLDKIKVERDQLVTQLKVQEKQFEQYIKNQRQEVAEFNLSRRNVQDGVELEKLREMSIKEKETKAEELKIIEDQHREKQKHIEEKYKLILMELNKRYEEKAKALEAAKEAIMAEKVRLHNSFKEQKQFVEQMIEAKLEGYRQELVARKLKIEELQTELRKKEMDMEEEKNYMAQMMSQWAAEMEGIRKKEKNMQEQIDRLQGVEKNLKEEISGLQAKEKKLKGTLEILRHKYQIAKSTAQNYREYAAKEKEFYSLECKRIDEGYKEAISRVQQNYYDILETQEREAKKKIEQVEKDYEGQVQKLRQKRKYKEKC
ncbi:golgin subfamily B member 1-like [Fopius arisanus]|uniref:CEP152 protein n=1 Tax=Fopius arisanus TaxID=64838 RepID=A0A0C9R141_9HYME|nr:PREDICTED: golgin subfamily B member 1-like [Fopius arisanus]